MRLEEIQRALALEVVTGGDQLDAEVSAGYASDLLSDVLANGIPSAIWVTRQTHVNIVAVALMKRLAAILLVHGERPQEDTIEKAQEEGVPILCTPLPSFEIIGRLYALGIRGLAPHAQD